MKRDPIENTKEYKEAMKKIQPELDALDNELTKRGYGMGTCHSYYARKKELLKNEGIDWKSPVECNPDVIFD